MENVPQVHGAANKDSFDDWCNFLLDLGYNNKWCDLNAKDFGVPQNRERTFMVSWLGDYYFDFPTGWKLTKKLRDVLEDKVDEKYYLSDDTIKRITGWKAQQDPLKHAYEERLCSPCITARGAGEEHSGMVLVPDKEVSNTVRGGGRASLDRHAWDIVVEKEDKFVEKKYKSFIKKQGKMPGMFNPYNETEIFDIAPTCSTCCGSMTSSATVCISEIEHK